MSSNQLYIERLFGFSFDTTAFDCDISKYVSSTFLQNEKLWQLLAAQSNYLAPMLPIVALVAELFPSMHFPGRLRRTLLLSGPAKWRAALPHYSFSIRCSLTRKVKSGQHLATGVCPGTSHGVPGQ